MKNYLFSFLLLSLSTYNYAQPRFLDSSFGNNGKVVTDFGSEESINSIAFQSDNKIVAAGYYDLIKKNLAFDWDVCALARYKTDGELDSSFGENGFITFDSTFSDLDAIVIQKDDKIAGTGYAYPFNSEGPAFLKIIRRQKNGEPDPSFGINGNVYFGDSITDFYGKAIALQDDGRFIVAGINNTINEWDSSFVFVARFNNNGTLDPGFGNNGSEKIIVGFRSFATSVALNSRGDIIISGYNTTNPGLTQPFVIALTSSGELNKKFGDNGIVITQLKNNSAFATMALTKDKKIIAGGYVQASDQSEDYNFFLIKYNSNGTTDSSFGMNGIVNSDLGYSDQITSIAIQPDEKIIAGGYSFRADINETYFALSRYSGDGMPDHSFGSQGRILTAFSGHRNTLSKILLQPDGKITAGGTSSIRRYGYGDFALSRYTNYNSENTGLKVPVALNPDKEKSIALVTPANFFK